MLKKMLILSIVILIIAPVSLDVKAETKNTPNDILVLGDSISSGYGLENYVAGQYDTKNYSRLLSKKYGIEKRVNNFAIDGQNSTQLIEKLNKGEYDDYIETSDLILVSIGGNDLLEVLTSEIAKAVGTESFSDVRYVNFRDKEVIFSIGQYLLLNNFMQKCISAVNNFKPNFAEITDYIYNKNPSAVVVYQTVYNPFSAVSKLEFINKYCGEIFKDLNNTIKNNTDLPDSTLKKYYVADVYNSFINNSLKYTNIADFDIHPNKSGHEKIAALIDEIVATKEFTVHSIEMQNNVPKNSLSNFHKLVISGGTIGLLTIISVLLIIRKNKNYQSK